MRISDWSSDVCSSDLFAGCIATAFQCEAHRGLQPGETEIAAGLAPQRPRQVEARGIAALCQPLDRRAAGIAQAEQLGGLVEGLTGGIVDGGPEPAVLPDALGDDELAKIGRASWRERGCPYV